MARAQFVDQPGVSLRLRGEEARFLKALLGSITPAQLDLILERSRADIIEEFRGYSEHHHPLHTIWDAMVKLDISERADPNA